MYYCHPLVDGRWLADGTQGAWWQGTGKEPRAWAAAGVGPGCMGEVCRGRINPTRNLALAEMPATAAGLASTTR
jgi:hypothetical protein